MNKNLHRIVFNKTRGVLMAVCESASSQAGGALAASEVRLDEPVVRFALRPGFLAVCLLTAGTFGFLPYANAQVVADPTAANNLRPQILNAANGVPLVNIQTPSAAGVSRNVYSQFDVQAQGVILNNARSNAQTQLGGWVQANPNLAAGAARIILNEVNSSNPSVLRGYMEVAGSRAQVVVANPAGITCDGCGFINTERATLTTGSPIMNGGSLDGYRVERGHILIQGNGLDASQTDYTDLIARSVEVNAGIWAKELRVTAGANQVNAANTQADRLNPSGPAPALAIDVAQLGGMYAGKIHLIGTEAGVGVKNAGSIGASAGEVRITVDGQVLNSGSITSTDTTAINATTLTNRGLLDGAKTQLAANTLDNLGTGRIYGDDIGIAASTLNNTVESGVAPTIAARNRLDLGVGTLNNREHALIHSEGDLAIGGALDSNWRATGVADVVNNASATIEAQGNLTLSALVFNNTNEHFSTEQVLISTESIHEHLGEGASTRYDHSLAHTQNVRDSFYRWVINGGEYDRSYEFIYTRTITETQVKSSDPAKLTAGGNLQLNIGSALNDKSQIIAGGNLDIVGGSLTNTTVPGQRITTDSGTVKHYIDHQPGGKNNDWTEVQTSAYNPAPSVLSMDLTPTVASANSTPSSTLPAGSLPNSSLYHQNPAANASYLVETDARFTNYRTWLSSDYMQQFLALDPSVAQKRLGDGFYEQQLIREQIAQLTGRRFLTGYASDEAQYQALMDSAVTQGKAFNLRLGVALSAAQIAQLTSDIVWLVEKEVKLPDGTTQKVLAPQVYLMPRTGDLSPSGALLAGANINIELSGDLVNRGTIAGRDVVSLAADNLRNLGGRIGGNAVALSATKDLENIGGRIEAVDSLSLSAGRDILVASSTRTQTTAQGSRTNIDRVAGLYVTGMSGTLSAVAGRDASFTGAEISNAGSGSTTLAASNNLTLGAVTESERQSLVFDSRNHRHETNTSDVGTRIRTQGDLTLLAGNDLTGKAIDAKAQSNLTLAAGNDITLSAGQRTQNIDEASFSQSKSKGLGGLGGTKRSASAAYQLDRSDAIDNALAGQNVTIQSGRDIALEGGRFVAQDKLVLAAERDITLADTYDTLQSNQSSSSKGGRSTKQQSEQVSSNTATGAILVAGSDLSLQSAGNTTVVGSALAAGNEISVKTGGDLALLSAESDRQVQSFDYNQGKRKAVTHTREETETRQLLSTITAGSGVAIDVQGNFTAEVAEKNADGSFKADRMTATGIEKGDSRQQVSITGSGSGGSSLAETAKKALAEGVRANANDAFTAGGQKTGQAAIESFLNSGLVQVGSNPKLDSQLKQILGDGKGLTSTEASGQVTLTVAGEAKVQEVYNALKLTEHFDVKKFPDAQTAQLVTLVVAVALTVCTAGTGAGLGVAMLQGAAISMASTMIGQLAAGASFDQAFKAGVKAAGTGAVMAGVTAGIGELVRAIPTSPVNGSTIQAGTNAASTTSGALEAMATPQYWAQTGLNALAKGAITQAQGGKFEDGALGSVIGSLAASGAGIIGDFTNESPLSNMLAHAALGCVAAAAGKQDCASGAIGGAASSVIARAIDGGLSNTELSETTKKAIIAGGSVAGSALLVEGLGGDTMTAGNAAANEVLNNYLTHNQIDQKKTELSNCKSVADCKAVQDKWNAIDKQQTADAKALLTNGNGSSVMMSVDTLKQIRDQLRVDCAAFCSADSLASLKELNGYFLPNGEINQAALSTGNVDIGRLAKASIGFAGSVAGLGTGAIMTTAGGAAILAPTGISQLAGTATALTGLATIVDSSYGIYSNAVNFYRATQGSVVYLPDSGSGGLAEYFAPGNQTVADLAQISSLGLALIGGKVYVGTTLRYGDSAYAQYLPATINGMLDARAAAPTGALKSVLIPNTNPGPSIASRALDLTQGAQAATANKDVLDRLLPIQPPSGEK